MFRTLLTAACCALLSACGPGLTITGPEDDTAVVVPTADGKVELTVEVPNFTLLPPGECGERENCGHLGVALTEGEEVEGAWSGTNCAEMTHLSRTGFTVDLSTCSRQVGHFGVFVELHTDDHRSLDVPGTTQLRRFQVRE